MENHEGCIRGYHRANRAYSGKHHKLPIIRFGMFDPKGGTSGAMEVRWDNLGEPLAPLFECYDDGWSALSLFTDVIQEMGNVDGDNITDDEFVAILDKCGFKDITQYDDPYVGKEIPPEEMTTITIPIGKARDLGLID